MRYFNRRNGSERVFSMSEPSISSALEHSNVTFFWDKPDDCSRGISSDCLHFVTNYSLKRIDSRYISVEIYIIAVVHSVM